jgi:hypothetical protein
MARHDVEHRSSGEWRGTGFHFACLIPPVYDRAELLIVAFDMMAAARPHLLDTSGHYAQPDVLQLIVDTREKGTVWQTS